VAKHHANEEVSDAIAYSLSRGWRFVKGSGHHRRTRVNTRDASVTT
jgi:hypothetical protein